MKVMIGDLRPLNLPSVCFFESTLFCFLKQCLRVATEKKAKHLLLLLTCIFYIQKRSGGGQERIPAPFAFISVVNTNGAGLSLLMDLHPQSSHWNWSRYFVLHVQVVKRIALTVWRREWNILARSYGKYSFFLSLFFYPYRNWMHNILITIVVKLHGNAS